MESVPYRLMNPAEVAEHRARLESITEQHYSPATEETLTLLSDPAENHSLQDQLAWFRQHPDSVLVYRTKAVPC